MGLDARVFINVKRLLSSVDLANTTIDTDTGEVTSDCNEAFIAMEKRLGNASMISWLSEQVARVLSNVPESAILMKVLYSATHSGDMIDLGDFPQLQREIEMIKEGYNQHPPVEIQQFLGDVQDLMTAALEQGNPIVFV